MFLLVFTVGIGGVQCLPFDAAPSSMRVTTLQPPIWPTVESGMRLLRPGPCTPDLRNCSHHGVCAKHGMRPVCLCSPGFHGNYCEVRTAPLPVIYVVSILACCFCIYAIIHIWCVCHRLHKERRPMRNGEHMNRVCEYGSLSKMSDQFLHLNGQKAEDDLQNS